jgi:HK97 family phage portal protein
VSLLDSLKALLGRGTRYDNIVYVGPTVSEVMGMGPEDLFRTQPHLRTVTTFVARNLAQLSLQTFERVSDADRRRTMDDPVALLLRRPNPSTTSYELVYRLAMDLKLYDVAVWMLVNADTPSGWEIYPIPPRWINSTGGGTAWAPQWMEVIRPGSGKRVILENAPSEPAQFLAFHGYSPSDPASWMSPVDALKDVLAEQIQAWTYRQQVWQRGGRVGTIITRPAAAPVWSDEARKQFGKDWAAKWTGPDGPKAGGTPILEDGMTLGNVRFNAREEEWSEVAKLSLATVAAVYHTSPTMVGVLDNANYSNVKEFSRMLYTDTLGPDIAMIEDRLNAFLVPQVSPNGSVYVEFNVQAKLAGSFEEQAQVLSTSVGRPWMTADEARGRLNMPSLGGDAAQLVTPLNVLVGGQASPRDSGTQNLRSGSAPGVKMSRDSAAAPLQVKAVKRDEDEKLASATLRKFFGRQRRAVLSELGSKDPDWWDADRWDRELSDDLYQLAVKVAGEIGADTMRALGFDPDQYSEARTVKFLRAVADSRAGAINSTTRDQVQAALDGDLDDESEMATPAGVFDVAEASRADQAGTSLATTLAAFAVTEAGKQTGRPGVTKTWTVMSTNPRPSHAAMDGETVGIDEEYSNGAAWPGDAVLDVDEIAGCTCTSTITIP